MSFCDEKLLKLNERMDQPLPSYSKTQINRTRVFGRELVPAPTAPDAKPVSTAEMLQAGLTEAARVVSKKLELSPPDRRLSSPQNSDPAAPNEGAKSQNSPQSRASLEKVAINKNINQMSADSDSGLENGEPRECLPTVLDRYFPGKRSKPGDTPPSPFLLNKRVKESRSSASNPESPLINPDTNPQKNKITDYFKVTSGSVTAKPADLAEVRDFSNANAIIKNEPPPEEQPGLFARWEAVVREKDREIVKLNKHLNKLEEEKTEFRQKARSHFSALLLELESLRRSERKTLINSEKLRIGEYVSYREGSKFKEVWVDGSELRGLREELSKILEQKEALEALRKKLKKRSLKIQASEDKYAASNPVPNPPVINPSVVNGYGLMGGLIGRGGYGLIGPQGFLLANMETSDSSNPVPAQAERAVEETRERIHAQLLHLSREEAFVKERIELIERQRDGYIRTAKNLYEEENCRFGKLSPAEADKRWPLLSSRYQIISLLGKGGFSEVYRAFDCEEVREVACKIHQLNPSWSEHQKSNYIRHALRENQVHRVLSHPNIVTHFDSVEIDSNSFCTVLEFCGGPDLAAFLKKHKTLPEKDARSIIKQILGALKFLNESDKKVIHYDLKPQNILFHNGMVKISDFGLCKVMSEGETRLELTSQGVGTYWYLPPECFSHEPPRISSKVDVWSIGVIYFEMLYGIKPFGHEMSQERILKEGIMLKAYSLEFPAKPALSAETKEFIKRCLEYHQENRFNVFEAWTAIHK